MSLNATESYDANHHEFILRLKRHGVVWKDIVDCFNVQFSQSHTMDTLWSRYFDFIQPETSIDARSTSSMAGPATAPLPQRHNHDASEDIGTRFNQIIDGLERFPAQSSDTDSLDTSHNSHNLERPSRLSTNSAANSPSGRATTSQIRQIYSPPELTPQRHQQQSLQCPYPSEVVQAHPQQLWLPPFHHVHRSLIRNVTFTPLAQFGSGWRYSVCNGRVWGIWHWEQNYHDHACMCGLDVHRDFYWSNRQQQAWSDC